MPSICLTSAAIWTTLLRFVNRWLVNCQLVNLIIKRQLVNRRLVNLVNWSTSWYRRHFVNRGGRHRVNLLCVACSVQHGVSGTSMVEGVGHRKHLEINSHFRAPHFGTGKWLLEKILQILNDFFRKSFSCCFFTQRIKFVNKS